MNCDYTEHESSAPALQLQVIAGFRLLNTQLRIVVSYPIEFKFTDPYYVSSISHTTLNCMRSIWSNFRRELWREISYSTAGFIKGCVNSIIALLLFCKCDLIPDNSSIGTKRPKMPASKKRATNELALKEITQKLTKEELIKRLTVR